VPHRFDIHTHRDHAEKIFRELFRFTFWQLFKKIIFQPCQPFRDPQLNGITRMIIVVQGASHGASFGGTIGFEPDALCEVFKPAMALEAVDIFAFYFRVVVVAE